MYLLNRRTEEEEDTCVSHEEGKELERAGLKELERAGKLWEARMRGGLLELLGVCLCVCVRVCVRVFVCV